MTLDWLLHSYQKRLMKTLYENPFQSFYLSEFARLSGVDPGNTKRYLEKFTERKLVLVEQRGRKNTVCANLANPEARKVFEMFELARTEQFLSAPGVRRANVEEFIQRLVEMIPDTRLIVMNNVERGLTDMNIIIDLAIVVGSKHDLTRVQERVQSIIDNSAFIHKFNICVYTCDNLRSAWNNGDCGCVGFWRDRAVLYGEAYYWEMIYQTSRGPDRIPEEMVQNA